MKKLEAQVNWSGAYDQRQWYVRIDNNFTGKATSINMESKTDADTLADAVNNKLERLKALIAPQTNQ